MSSRWRRFSRSNSYMLRVGPSGGSPTGWTSTGARWRGYLQSSPPDLKPAIPPAGSGEVNATQLFCRYRLPVLGRTNGSDGTSCTAVPNTAIPPTRVSGRQLIARRRLELHRSLLTGQASASRSAGEFSRSWVSNSRPNGICKDLTTDPSFTGSYDNVKRFVPRLGTTALLPFRRMECAPGEEAQVDFGSGAAMRHA